MSTGVLPLNSQLKRNKWMREGMVQAASKSFWSPLTGKSSESVVYQENDISAKQGHTVIFDYSGNLTGRAIKGKNTAYGKGETKRKFSDSIRVARYRIPVNNGDVFDGVDIGDLNINQHSDSRAKLADLFVRFKDQGLFDVAQGLARTSEHGVQEATHIIDLGATFTFNQLIKIETILKTGRGYSNTDDLRAPLKPFRTDDGQMVWLFVCDAFMLSMLRRDTAGYQNIVNHADVRGSKNRNIKGIVGKLGSLLLVEADSFFGETSGTGAGWGFEDSEIEIAGLRQYDGTDPTSAAWTGQTSFDHNSDQLHSRGLILGAGALQCAMGKQPDYKFQESQDFAIDAESAVEFWTEYQKSNLTAENKEYKQAKISDIDFGVVAVDLKVELN